jgi:CRP-like cAMP-binding protein
MITIMSNVVFDALAQEAKPPVSLEPEQLLFNQDDEVSVVYLLQSGALDLVRNQENGDRVILRRTFARSIVAEASIYSRRYHCDCVCVQGAQVRALPVRRVQGNDRARGRGDLGVS